MLAGMVIWIVSKKMIYRNSRIDDESATVEEVVAES